jgi:hypothetical protein
MMPMSTTRPDEELSGEQSGAGPADDMSTVLTRGVVDGFTEASEAFSHELQGTDRFPDLMGRSVAGMIRANARLLDEMANVIRQMSDGFSVRARMAADGRGFDADSDPLAGLDYERLADLVAQRLQSAQAVVAAAEPAAATTGRARKA